MAIISSRLLSSSKPMGLVDNNGGKNQQRCYSLKFICSNKEKKPVATSKAVGTTAVLSEPITTMTPKWKISDLSLLADNVTQLKLPHLQFFIEKVCIFFNFLVGIFST